MLTNTERQQIVEEVNAGTYGIDEALDDIAAAQKGEEVRKALYAEALVLNREGHAGSTDMIARQQIANLQTSVNGQIGTLRTEVGDDIDDLETALNSGLATQNGRIAAQNATIANVVANYNVEYGSTELWASTGETGALAAGTTVTLSEDVSHFDYIDIYSFCGNSNVLDTVPVDAKLQSSQGYALRWVNLSDPGSGTYEAYVRIVETKIKIIGTTLTIVHQVTYRNGSAVSVSGAEITQSNRSTYVGELGIMKVVGRKITANTEIEDVRIGADGTEYASAGQAVRAQIGDVADAIPAIDTTLSVSGAAADAKAVGEALAEKADSADVTALDTRVTVVEGDVESLKDDLNILTEKNLEFVETATAGATNAYKVIENKLLVDVEYAFKVTSRTAGTYLFQAGIGQSASSMYDIGTYTFSAGKTKTITGYSTNNRNIKYFRLYSADVSLENMDWDVSVYTYYDAQKEISDVSERVDIEINDANKRIMATWGSVLLESVPVEDESVSNWYKSTPNALENVPYDFVITAQTPGTYLFQIGIGASASNMSLTVGEYTFTAGETKSITYTPAGSNLRFFRFYSASVPAANTLWTLEIRRDIKASEIQKTQDAVSTINTLLGCEYLPTVKGEYYNTSGTTVDITSPNSNPGWNSAVVPCVENDVFTITGTGGSSPRLWAFAASDGTIISHQDSAVTPSTVTDYILYAPANSAYFIANFANSAPFRLLKGLTLDYRFSIEDYENRITTKHKVIVDANGNGDYTTIQAAINSITDSSFTNQYEIILKAGTYTEQNLILPPYTYLHGVGQVKPVITSEGLTEYVSVIDAQNTCRIANVKVVSGTKYCLHEDVSLHGCTVICENVDFEQLGTSNVTIIGNGVFENAKFIFNGCTFKGGQVFSHTNSNSFIGVTQHLVIRYCKFDNAGIVLSVSGNVESNTMADCICEVVGCRGDGTYPLITCRVPTDNVFPWKVIGGGNINFSVVYDGETLTGVVNTTDAV